MYIDSQNRDNQTKTAVIRTHTHDNDETIPVLSRWGEKFSPWWVIVPNL